MSIHTAGWAIIGSVSIGALSILGNIYLAFKSRNQVIDQAASQFKQAAASLDVQRTSTARAASTFIADKRQKWIDELRTETSHYIALTLELTEAWKRLCDAMNEVWYEVNRSPQDQLDECADLRSKFEHSIAASNSEHYQLLVRVTMRLNNDELTHQGLINALRKLRGLLADLQVRAQQDRTDIRDLLILTESESQFATGFTKSILKEEWQKLKREVADPERLIADILATGPSLDYGLETLVRKGVARVSSPLSTVAPAPTSAPPSSNP
ncbi:hypothetical protein SAMN05443245_7615 [Paraburkholderia fungorum]|uniref:Uncharacterized protein n=1 Tax=Paraburkholderia fungorum TaxID=134537 RepID=A0A1H1JYP8_9BURK|nr:hypothetical protein [Paraburkholderia fungorum]SDR55168.1 hypothetical protein SAMN05443245_7615 [Paraburkholderia fungorum]